MNLLEKQSMSGTIIVAKIGGSILNDEQLLGNLLADVKSLVQNGVSIAIVHGGGAAIDQKLAAAGIAPKKIQGLRVTDAITLSIVIEVMASINDTIVQKLSNLDLPAIGFQAQSNPILLAEKLLVAGTDGESVDLEFVGKIVNTNSAKIQEAFAKGAVPVLAPLGIDGNGTIYNINADHVARAIATSAGATKLINVTDVPGILSDSENPKSVIKSLDVNDANGLLTQGSINGGMLPKLESCVKALNDGVAAVQIIDGHEPHCLWKAASNSEEIGSLICKTKEHS